MSKGICSIEGCDRTARARGWCGMHYQRWQRNGDPRVRVLAESPEDAFRAYTEQRGECLVWVGEISARGYGRISAGDHKREPAHRWAWEREHGPVPEGKVLDHLCYNRACVRVDHLRLATIQQNTQRRRGANPNNLGTGVRNVYRERSRYAVRIKVDGVIRDFGRFATLEEASEVARERRAELFGNFAGEAP